ncbi:MAG: outer membrane beta-barrel protein, partial [Proteobacteria bacterium]|nr:outer membrane beta-barrel protein [Pseudomonadota bacterium]
VFSIIVLIHSSYAADTPPAGQSPIPSGQSKGRVVTQDEGINADIFGQKGGRFHPFLLLEEIYTDNLFATHSNTKADFITTISPGIWLAFPANREKLLSIDTTTTSPGGLQLSRIKPEATRRYQTYFLYSPDFVFYSDYSNHDHVNHKAEALFQYNFNSGLSFDLIDIFHDREEIAGNGVIDTLYRHQDNLLDFITTYDAPSGKFKVQLTYSNYDLAYKDSAVDYRDRNDNSVGLSVFYKFWPKTSLFVEYDYSIIKFDTGSANDSVENRYYGGVTWDITAKTRGTLKLGYMDKDFDLDSVKDHDGFSFEVQTQHNLTSKRALQINGYQKFHESDLANASTFLSTGIDVAVMQRFTEKWSGTLSAFFKRNEYKGYSRDDDLYGFGPAIRFEPRKWLIFDLGYTYYRNDSNVTFYDYEANMIFLRASLSM